MSVWNWMNVNGVEENTHEHFLLIIHSLKQSKSLIKDSIKNRRNGPSCGVDLIAKRCWSNREAKKRRK